VCPIHPEVQDVLLVIACTCLHLLSKACGCVHPACLKVQTCALSWPWQLELTAHGHNMACVVLSCDAAAQPNNPRAIVIMNTYGPGIAVRCNSCALQMTRSTSSRLPVPRLHKRHLRCVTQSLAVLRCRLLSAVTCTFFTLRCARPLRTSFCRHLPEDIVPLLLCF
jgi:hypothetical protein